MTETAERAQTSVELGVAVAAGAESRMLIAGVLVEAASGRTYPNIAPATGKTLGHTAAADAPDMLRAIDAARRAFDDTDWSTDRELRRRCLLELQAAIEAEAEDLRSELVAEVGAPLMTTTNAQLDWPLAQALRYPAGLIEDYEWERTLDGGGLFGERNVRTVVSEPVGVVAAITPSNYPIEVILNKLGPALAAGNTVVLKPDPNTPWNATRLGRLIAEKTSFPPGVINVVTTDDNEVANLLATDPRVDLISFTGSTAVGQHLMREGASTMKRMFLELGGKSALVVLEDVDPMKTVMAAVGTCSHAGQACAVNSRMLVHKSIFDDVLTAVTDAYRMLPVGDPASPDTFVGPLITDAAAHRVRSALDTAAAQGAEIVTGGSSTPPGLAPHLDASRFVMPTIVAGVDNGAPIAQEEIFGPVLVMIPFVDDADAVRIANDSRFGLAGAVMSQSQDRAETIARQMRTGAVGVNGGMFYAADAPFGGYKNSGVGRQCGIEGFAHYLQTKTIAVRTPRTG